jgi:hypothetical protein
MKETRQAGVRAQTLIAVQDVKASSTWYQTLLGVRSFGDPDHPHRLVYDRVMSGDAVDDFDAAVERARRLRAPVVEEPHVNPAPQHREMWIRDPNGYVVVLASPDGEAR